MYETITSGDISFKRRSPSIAKFFRKVYMLLSQPTDVTQNLLIDASAMGYDGIFDLIQQLTSEIKRKIIIIPIINTEMDRLQKFKGEDLSKSNARKFLNLAAENKGQMFVYEDFESSYTNPDDIIQDYAFQNKESIILVSADKRLVSNCRALDIPVYFVNVKRETQKTRGRRVATFYNAKYAFGHLLLVPSNPVTAFMVKHGEGDFKKIPNGETYDLQVGDEVLLCREKFDTTTNSRYLSFAHYEITAISEKNNISTLFTHRFYDADEVQTLWNPTYRSFILDFMAEHFAYSEMNDPSKKTQYLNSIM